MVIELSILPIIWVKTQFSLFVATVGLYQILNRSSLPLKTGVFKVKQKFSFRLCELMHPLNIVRLLVKVKLGYVRLVKVDNFAAVILAFWGSHFGIRKETSLSLYCLLRNNAIS